MAGNPQNLAAPMARIMAWLPILIFGPHRVFLLDQGMNVMERGIKVQGPKGIEW